MSGKGKKCKAYLEETEKYVIDLMMKGKSPSSIMQDLMENRNVNTISTAKMYVRKCNEKIRLADENTVEQKIAQYKEMYLNIYEKSLIANERKNAREALDSLIKLEGLLVNKVEAKINGIFEVTFE